jgi:WD40 repeat protein
MRLASVPWRSFSWVRAMVLHRVSAWWIVCLASFAVAWLMVPRAGRSDDAFSDSTPPPTVVTAYRMLVRSPKPAGSLIAESVAFSPDGNAVASGRAEVTYNRNGKPVSTSTVVSICRPSDGTSIGRIELANGEGCSVAYSPDGLTLAVGLAGEVKLYDARANKQRGALKASERAYFDRLTFSADGRRLAAASFDSIVVWDLTAGRLNSTIRAGMGLVHGVAFSPDGASLASAAEAPPAGARSGSSRRSHSTSLAVRGQIALWNQEGQPAGPSFDYSRPAHDVAFAANGRTLAIAGEDGVRLWKTGSAGLPRAIAPTPAYCVAYSRDGRYLAIGTEEFSYITPPGEIRLWDTRSGRDRIVLQAKMGRVRSVAFAPDGHAVVAATREGVFLWDLVIPSLEDKALSLSGGSALEGDNGDMAHAHLPSAPKQTKQSTTPAEDLFLVAMTALFAVSAPIAFVWWWRALWLVYRAREQCRWLLESWLERDGMTLIHSQMIFIPPYLRLFYRVRVEDGRGRQFQGWAEVSGKFWSTPEFVPLRVDYYFTRRVAPRMKEPLTADKIALWDDWLDRQRDA